IVEAQPDVAAHHQCRDGQDRLGGRHQGVPAASRRRLVDHPVDDLNVSGYLAVEADVHLHRPVPLVGQDRVQHSGQGRAACWWTRSSTSATVWSSRPWKSIRLTSRSASSSSSRLVIHSMTASESMPNSPNGVSGPMSSTPVISYKKSIARPTVTCSMGSLSFVVA